MSTHRAKIWVLGLLAGLSVGVAQAAPIVDVESSEGQFFNTEGPLSFESDGADLDGAIVTACFFDGNCYEEIWQENSPNAGDAGGTVEENTWSLSLTGDSFDQAFSFSNVSRNSTNFLGLTSFSVNTVNSNAFFDIETSDPDATDGTQRGQPFTLDFTFLDLSSLGSLGSAVTNIDVTYSNQLAVGGTIIPNSQLFTFMQVNFSGDNEFTGFRGQFSFLSDTDRTNTSITSVPEPNTLALFTTGLLLGFLVWRRRQVPHA